jgi:4-azaleucine resistance transporter AzlC
MTALFVIIFIDQWEKCKNHLPALLGLGVSVLCLLLFGESNFMLPSLLVVSGLLLFSKEHGEAQHE